MYQVRVVLPNGAILYGHCYSSKRGAEIEVDQLYWAGRACGIDLHIEIVPVPDELNDIADIIDDRQNAH